MGKTTQFPNVDRVRQWFHKIQDLNMKEIKYLMHKIQLIHFLLLLPISN